MDWSRIHTRDVLAVLVVAAALIFNGISLITGREADVATMTLAGLVVGFYFKQGTDAVASFRDTYTDGPVGDPSFGDDNK